MQPEKAYLPLRTYLCFRTLIVVVSLFVGGSLNGKLVEQSGEAGFAVLFAQAALAIIGLLDIIINDVLPDRFRIPTARFCRHYVYIGLALCNSAFLLVMAKNDTLTLLALSYVVDGIAAVWIAVGTIIRNQRTSRYPYVDRRK